MLKLLSYLKPYWKAVLLAPLLMLIEVVTDLLQPKLVANIIDYGIATGDMDYIMRTGLLMIGIAIIGLMGGFGCVIASGIASQSFGADLRSALFKKVQSFSFANLDTFKTSSLITRLTNDVTQVQNVVLMSLRIMVRAPLLSIGGIIMAVSINPRLARILLIAIPVLAFVLAFVARRGFPLFSKVQARLDRVNDVMRENLAGIRVVKAFVRSDLEKERFASANEALMEITVKASRIMALTMPFIMLVMHLSIVAILWFGGIQVNNGQMQVGEVVAFINYMTQILFSLMLVAFVFIMLSRAKASADRIQEVLQTEIDLKDLPQESTAFIKQGGVVFENVSFHYTGSKGEPILKNISFTADPGQTIAILGGIGSGKTTLVSLIPRLYDATEGRVLIDGQDVRNIPLDLLRGSVGFVLQESVLFTGSIRENLCWGKENASDTEIERVAQMAQAHDFIMSFPEGYNTQLGQKGVNLSGGQKQRLAIARALLKKPPILILDDSTSAVDLGTELRIRAALNQRKEKPTVFLIAQRISSVMDADKILVLEDGRIAAEGIHQQLLETSAIYQDIYQSQMGEGAAYHVE
ncbi:ABC transporter ATP-binding protein [Geosporobacter ferrireducens]|uniref:Multidrug ABC transporter ATP-binding protein n=1 Tax=Geosporobacter ferrireducens TaxID=1424294 RepID=A0A1D8GIS5_9FIRM|nr:ABC transporter ATP-binding protein [Geosporobacter ferrireducens]AOT70788.1 multidrug ABC transporter ATP-binding protein [Geosporobacter ferrireducens]MTI53481.1 ABC transporter ATP-binding protein [Geosporobacter ferrireducens]